MKDQTSPTVANNENPGSSSGSITRRQAIAGGMSGLVAAVLSAKTAVAQVALPQPLLRFGGLCEGRVLKFNAADSLAWIQKMLTKSPSLRAFHDHFTAEGMNFILSRSQVFLHMATGSGSTAGMAPNIVGIMPSFRQIKQSDPSHTAVGLGVNQRGNAFASGVVVGHNPFAIQKFMTHDLLATGEIATKEITADSLTTMTVAEAAAQLGNPPIPDGLIGPNPVFLAEPDRSATLALAYGVSCGVRRLA